MACLGAPHDVPTTFSPSAKKAAWLGRGRSWGMSTTVGRTDRVYGEPMAVAEAQQSVRYIATSLQGFQEAVGTTRQAVAIHSTSRSAVLHAQSAWMCLGL